jgi:hypothetical protein
MKLAPATTVILDPRIAEASEQLHQARGRKLVKVCRIDLEVSTE